MHEFQLQRRPNPSRRQGGKKNTGREMRVNAGW